MMAELSEREMRFRISLCGIWPSMLELLSALYWALIWSCQTGTPFIITGLVYLAMPYFELDDDSADHGERDKIAPEKSRQVQF
ncbi:hypothetical protein PO124_30740 [Bacillus licheniformis]|nr:hypothetical protein [Bacillus licheniformis]